jgi:hypothetical protein
MGVVYKRKGDAGVGLYNYYNSLVNFSSARMKGTIEAIVGRKSKRHTPN